MWHNYTITLRSYQLKRCFESVNLSINLALLFTAIYISMSAYFPKDKYGWENLWSAFLFNYCFWDYEPHVIGVDFVSFNSKNLQPLSPCYLRHWAILSRDIPRVHIVFMVFFSWKKTINNHFNARMYIKRGEFKAQNKSPFGPVSSHSQLTCLTVM